MDPTGVMIIVIKIRFWIISEKKSKYGWSNQMIEQE